jgi:hypothetical protein
VPIGERLAGLLFDRAGRLLQAALDPLSIHVASSLIMPCDKTKAKRTPIQRDTNPYNFVCCYVVNSCGAKNMAADRGAVLRFAGRKPARGGGSVFKGLALPALWTEVSRFAPAFGKQKARVRPSALR